MYLESMIVAFVDLVWILLRCTGLVFFEYMERGGFPAFECGGYMGG